MMNTESRIKLKFLVCLGKTPLQAPEIFSKCLEISLCCVRVFELHKTFKEWHEEVKDNSKNWRPLTSRTEVNVKQLRQVVCGDHRLTIRLIASQLDRKRDSVCKIITEDLGIRKICAKWCQNCEMMIRRCPWCRCVRKLLSILKLNQTCFVDSLLVIRHRFLSKTRTPSARAVRRIFPRRQGRRKQVK